MTDIPDYTAEEMADAHKSYLEWLRTNPNNFSFWYPKVRDCGLKMPDSRIFPLSDSLVECLFVERPGDRETLEEFVRTTVLPEIPQEWNGLFLKNGCFSDKFSFRLCRPLRDAGSITDSILAINMDSMCFDTGGNAELVLREYISDDKDKHHIYEGMPLRPEIRIFFDFDRRKSLYWANYWDRDCCSEAVHRTEEDGKEYDEAYDTLEQTVRWCSDDLMEILEKRMKNVKGLEGIWSVDLMYAGGDWWLIDMALGHMSAYWDTEKVKKALERTKKEG